jgi:hypothetical protein
LQSNDDERNAARCYAPAMFIWQEYPSFFRGIRLALTYPVRRALAIRHRLVEAAVSHRVEQFPKYDTTPPTAGRTDAPCGRRSARGE